VPASPKVRKSQDVLVWFVTIEVAVTSEGEHGHTDVESMSGAADERRRRPGRRKSPRSMIAYPSIPSSFAAVPPRILIRSSSLSPGIDITWSTGAVFHGNG
jgi:hypothetical protein